VQELHSQQGSALALLNEYKNEKEKNQALSKELQTCKDQIAYFIEHTD